MSPVDDIDVPYNVDLAYDADPTAYDVDLPYDADLPYTVQS